MSYFIRDTGSNLTPLQHSYEIFKQYILNNYFSTLTGRRGSGSPIIIDDALFKGKGAGDVGRYHFIPQYKGEGIEGQNPSITGNEKSLDEFYMDFRVDQIAQAFSKKGKMTDLRTIWNFREEFKNQLAEWFRDRTESDLVDALTGYITDGVSRQTDTTKLINGEGRCFRVDKDGEAFKLVKTSPADASDTMTPTETETEAEAEANAPDGDGTETNAEADVSDGDGTETKAETDVPDGSMSGDVPPEADSAPTDDGKEAHDAPAMPDTADAAEEETASAAPDRTEKGAQDR